MHQTRRAEPADGARGARRAPRSPRHEFRLFLLAIALPALLVAGGGARLLALEARHADEAARESLRLRAGAVASEFERAVAEKTRLLLEPLAAETNAAARAAAARRAAESDPDVAEVRVLRRPGPMRGMRGREAPRGVRGGDPPRGGRGARGPRGESGGPGARPFRRGPPPRPEGEGGPRPFGEDDGPGREAAPVPLSYETRLATGETCWVRFAASAAAALLSDAARAGGKPVPARVALTDGDGLELAVCGDAVADAVRGDAPVPRTNARLVAEWPAAAVARGGSRRLLLLGGCLLALLVCSLFAGGALLVRAARRERLDALRKTDFVDNVSHELKTPLAGIRLSAELLSEGRLPEGPRRDRAVRSILAESDRLDRLVSNLLDFGHLERGRRRFDLRSVDLRALLEERCDDPSSLRKEERGAGVGEGTARTGRPERCAFRMAPCGASAAALADPDAVRQILANLLDNAAKYAGEGGPPDVTVRTLPGGDVAVEVADRGPGVPHGLEEKVFERFFRVDNATNRRTNGSGIGLALARALARGMGGDLVCFAREGGGAVFRLSLPAAEADSRADGAAAPSGGDA